MNEKIEFTEEQIKAVEDSLHDCIKDEYRDSKHGLREYCIEVLQARRNYLKMIEPYKEAAKNINRKFTGIKIEENKVTDKDFAIFVMKDNVSSIRSGLSYKIVDGFCRASVGSRDFHGTLENFKPYLGEPYSHFLVLHNKGNSVNFIEEAKAIFNHFPIETMGNRYDVQGMVLFLSKRPNLQLIEKYGRDVAGVRVEENEFPEEVAFFIMEDELPVAMRKNRLRTHCRFAFHEKSGRKSFTNKLDILKIHLHDETTKYFVIYNTDQSPNFREEMEAIYNHFPMKNPSGKNVRGVVLFLNAPNGTSEKSINNSSPTMSWQVRKRKHMRPGEGVREIKMREIKKMKENSFFCGTNLLDIAQEVVWNRQVTERDNMKENNKKTEKTKKAGKTGKTKETKKTGLAERLEMSVMFLWESVLEKYRGKLRGGPGMTQETAWEVLEKESPEAVELEYDVMRELLLPRAHRQKLVVGEDGRRYDVHEICSEGRKESGKLQMWFDITAYWENLHD